MSSEIVTKAMMGRWWLVVAAAGLYGCGGAGDDEVLADEATSNVETAAVYTGCWGSGGTQTDYNGFSYGTRYCHAYSSGNVVWADRVRGYLRAGNSWFVCQEEWPDFPNPQVGSAQNDWWLYTQADTSTDSNHGWGWFPATRVSGGANWQPIPNLRDCGEIPGFPDSTP